MYCGLVSQADTPLPTKTGQQCVLWNREAGCELQEKLVPSSLAVGAAGNCRIRAAAVLAFASLAAESHFVAVCVRDPAAVGRASPGQGAGRRAARQNSH